jgi:A/G-specific adenine glycosylase
MASPLIFPKIRQKILRWYAFSKRDLPWRRTRDPYRIWVSEIMLQQTQVATVIPYYKKWLRAFPSLRAFAKAPLSKALRFWAGLGYYRRARMFHEAARWVTKEFKGRIPQTAEALRKLPGIGRYTAGAVASIAFGEKTPVLDGNVIRILTRIFAVAQSIDHPVTLERLWKISEALLPDKNPGDLNQALMELGATVCFPFDPQCGRCPVKKICSARRKRREISFPVRSQKNKYKKLHMVALVVRNAKKEVWLEKQDDHARWGGLWMFPFWGNQKDMLSEIGGVCSEPVFLLKVAHAFTKYRITLEVYEASLLKGLFSKKKRGKWFSVAGLSRLALPSPHRKIAEFLASR